MDNITTNEDEDEDTPSITNARQGELVASEDLTPAEDLYPAPATPAAIAGDSLIPPFIAGTGEPVEAKAEAEAED